MDHGDHVTVAVVVVVATLCQVRHTSPRRDRHLITKYRKINDVTLRQNACSFWPLENMCANLHGNRCSRLRETVHFF